MFLVSQFGSWYNTCLDSFPLLTKTATTAFIGLIGDAAAQLHEERRRAKEQAGKSAASATTNFRYDTRRGLANVASNIFLTAPIYHYGYEWLESLMPVYTADTTSVLGSSLAALGQVLIDCILFDAIFVLLMYVTSDIIEGPNVNVSTISVPTAHQPNSTRTNLVPAIIASWQINIFMIPIEFILFRYFPLRLRVLGMNMIDLVWETVVSVALHDERKEEQADVLFKGPSNEITPSSMSTAVSTPCHSNDELCVEKLNLDSPMVPSSKLDGGHSKQKQS